MKEFNLILTSRRGDEIQCSKEFTILAKRMNYEIEVKRTKFSGLLICKIEGDPLEFVRKARKIIEEDPWSFRFIQRIIPVQWVVDFNSLKDLVRRIEIPEGYSFKVVVNKRGSNLSSREIIEVVASAIDRRVDLENPDYIIQIEVIENLIGLSIIKRDDIISIPKMQEEILSK
ncbi:MAG: THUMP domain-containing protein [Candidatus Methanomethyliaceae archaeon]|nr:THUMP domain-containing protein [Candidatus Methanomethyliaceae archaeon]MDW7971513.1 THUMP domain-containing protein [Nitrososphaerota archaeon]